MFSEEDGRRDLFTLELLSNPDSQERLSLPQSEGELKYIVEESISSCLVDDFAPSPLTSLTSLSCRLCSSTVAEKKGQIKSPRPLCSEATELKLKLRVLINH